MFGKLGTGSKERISGSIPLKIGPNLNQLPGETSGTFPCKPKSFRNRVRKATINEVKSKEYNCG